MLIQEKQNFPQKKENFIKVPNITATSHKMLNYASKIHNMH